MSEDTKEDTEVSATCTPMERIQSILENSAPVSDAFRLEEIKKVLNE